MNQVKNIVKRATGIGRVALAEICRFDGIVVAIYTDERDEPHIHAGRRGKWVRLSIPAAEPIGKKKDVSVQQKIRDWFALQVPIEKYGTRSISDLAYDQWLRGRNGKLPERVPTPDEVKAMARSAARTTKKRWAASKWGYYAIRKVEPLSAYRLKVYFKTGEVRIADIKAMRGTNPMFREAFRKFDDVKWTQRDVSWGVGLKAVEIEDQDLWGAGELVAGTAPSAKNKVVSGHTLKACAEEVNA
jgi:hypothetical protein